MMKSKSELIRKIKKAREEIGNIVKKRLKEFNKVRSSSKKKIFEELSFCLLTANFNAERSWTIQNKIKSGFLTLSEAKLSKKLRELGHRFPNTRANYIVRARKHIDKVYDLVKSRKDPKEIREWLVRNIKGLGYKEASHFLRNIGLKDVAIIDFHILDLLAKYNIIEKPKSLSKRKYLEIEKVLESIAKKIGVSLAELDLLMWYLETGKILK